ncbi:MAG TPA: TIM barrel protein [Longimicrobium sp.]|jgi:sugar phosphate isomerase/epimerase
MTSGVRVRRAECRPERLDEVRAAGFVHVEWEWSWNGAGSSPVPSAGELASAARALAGAGLTCSVAGPTGISVAEKVDPLRAVSTRLWRELYQAAGELGARWVVLELGQARCAPDETEKRRRRIDLARPALHAILEGSDGGPLLLVENQRRLDPVLGRTYLGDHAADLVHLLDGLPPERAGIMFDAGHPLIGQDPLAFLEGVDPWIRAVALHANDGVRDEHRALEPGDVDRHPAYWHGLARRAAGLPVVVEIDDLDAARSCWHTFSHLP